MQQPQAMRLAFRYVNHGLCCSLCNPANLADLESGGVVVTCFVGQDMVSSLSFCLDCLGDLAMSQAMRGKEVTRKISGEVAGLFLQSQGWR